MTTHCICRPSDRWCPVARRLRSTMSIAGDEFRFYRSTGRPQDAAKARRAYDLAEKMLRGHLARVTAASAAKEVA